MNRLSFSDFGKELKRSFAVAGQCYDCAEFYDGCNGWRASQDFGCRQYNRLPDVLPGTCGQAFPAPRRRTPSSPIPEPVELRPNERPALPAEPTVRICGCGAPLSKGRRLCDNCRVANRRRTKCEYMRTYMKQRRSVAVGCGSDLPSAAAQGTSARASGHDLLPRVLR